MKKAVSKEAFEKEMLEIVQRIEKKVAELPAFKPPPTVEEDLDFYTRITRGMPRDEASAAIAQLLSLTRNPLLEANLVATLAFSILSTMEMSGVVEFYIPDDSEETYVRWAD